MKTASSELRTKNCSSVARVVGMAGEDCAGAVDLFGEDQAGESVGEGERAEGEKDLCARECCGGPAAGGTDGKDDVLDAFVAAST